MLKKGSVILKIPLGKPVFDDEMKEAAIQALLTERFVMGESVFKFEEEFARFCGTKFAVSTSSGTVALQLSLEALGVKQENNVITTPYSFIATANSVLCAGAIPSFTDIEAKTCNINPDLIQNNITDKTKAIMPVHLYGYPSDMGAIMDISEDKKIVVVEDACQAHGAQYHGEKIGSIGEVGCFSFYPSKNMTVCGDGGMVTTNNEDVAKIIAKLRNCGRKSHYEHDLIGITARLNTVNAAIGRIQLKRLDKWNEQRRAVAMLYNKLLDGVGDLNLMFDKDPEVRGVYHLYIIRTQYRNALKSWLETQGVQCGIHYPIPIPLQPIYQELYGYKEGDFSISELVSRTTLSLPMFPELQKDDIHYICEKIREFFDQKKKLNKGDLK